MDPVGRCSQHVSKIRSRTAELITRTIPSKQVRVGLPPKQRNSNVESRWISTPSLAANPPAAPPPASPAPEQGGPRSREEGETDASDFVPSQSSSQAATADDLVPRQLSSLAAIVAANLLLVVGFLCGCAV